MKKLICLILALLMVLSLGTAALASGEASAEASGEAGADASAEASAEASGEASAEGSGEAAAEALPEDRCCEHTFDYLLQPDSYEATDTEGGWRHYACSVCGAEYAYATDPLVYAVNPKTGAAVDQAGTKNPYLPLWEHIPDAEPHVFWSKADGEWRVYIYGSHDITFVCSDDHVTWSAPVYDLSDWRFEGDILRLVLTEEEQQALIGADGGNSMKLEAGALFAPDCAYDLVTDAYYLAAFETGRLRCAVYRATAPDSDFGALGRDGALYTWNIGTWAGATGEEGEYALTDPAILFEDGVMYVGGNVQIVGMPEESQKVIEADGYAGGSYAVIYQLEKNADGEWECTGISTCPTENEPFLPVGEGISLRYLEEFDLYFMAYYNMGARRTDGVAAPVGGLAYVYTDDLMNGVWRYGENGFNDNVFMEVYGIYYKDADGSMASSEMTTINGGGNHGGIEKINGEWYVFDHRSSDGGRQGVIEKINIHMDGDALLVDATELTSSGPAGKTDAYSVIEAGIACYLTGGVALTGYTDNHDRYTTENIDFDVTHYAPLYGTKDGAVAGYKYLDFGEAETNVTLKLLVYQADDASASAEASEEASAEAAPAGPVSGSAEVWIDAPTAEKGGTRIGEIAITPEAIAASTETETGTDGTVWSWISGEMDEAVSGVHGVYLVFHGGDGAELCKLDQLCFAAG